MAWRTWPKWGKSREYTNWKYLLLVDEAQDLDAMRVLARPRRYPETHNGQGARESFTQLAIHPNPYTVFAALFPAICKGMIDDSELKVYELARNYRSDKAIVDAANRLIGPQPQLSCAGNAGHASGRNASRGSHKRYGQHGSCGMDSQQHLLCFSPTVLCRNNRMLDKISAETCRAWSEAQAHWQDNSLAQSAFVRSPMRR